MKLSVALRACSAGGLMPLSVARVAGMPSHRLASPLVRQCPFIPVGTGLYDANDVELLRVTGRCWLPADDGGHRVAGDDRGRNHAHRNGEGEVPRRDDGGHALQCLMTRALVDLPVGEISLETRRTGRALAWVTLSDKGSQGMRDDTSGPAMAALVADTLPLCHSQGFLLPDDAVQLRALLVDLALNQGYDVICTSGGTGVGPRDISPQVTSAVLDYPLPGFSMAMMQASLAKTPHAAISRAVAGVLGQSIIINLPGSRKAVVENLEAVLPALPHALDKLHGDPADCGG